MRRILPILLLLAACGSEPAAENAAVDPSRATAERWDQVATVVNSIDPAVRVDPSEDPTRMVIRVPIGAFTEDQARQMALTAWERLGSDALVAVRDEGGKTLATATSMGVQ